MTVNKRYHNSKTDSKAKPSATPKTGDSTFSVAPVAVAAVGALAAGIILRKRLREE